MDKIQLRDDDGNRTVRISAGPIIEKTIGIHFSVGRGPNEAAQCIKDGLFSASHIATGNAIISKVPKDIAIKVGHIFLKLLPVELRFVDEAGKIIAALPKSFGQWVREIEDSGQYRDYEPVAVAK